MRTPRTLAVEIAWQLYGQPYRWGGDDTIEGFDCSGMENEVYKSVGKLPHEGDWTAQQLYLHFRGFVVEKARAGAMACYGTLSKITHVMLCLDADYVIGATGGGSATTTLEAAAAANAFVKVRPLRYRNDLVAIVDPFKDEEDVAP